MITLHNATDTTFTTNGLGVLEPLSCILNLEINGGWSLEMEHPLDADMRYMKLKEGNIIKVTGIGVVREQTEPYQLFRIYDVNKGLNSLKVIAFPVAFEATYDAVIDEYSTGSSEKTINSLLNDSTNGIMKKLSDEGVTKYTCSVNYPNCPTHKNDWKNTNLIAIIGGSNEDSILNKYDAEVAYDNYTIRINHRIGEETDFEIRYGKNLTGLDVDTDTSGVVTRFYPISKEGIRYKGLNNEPYVESEEVEEYPFARCAFIQTDYQLVDTNEKSYSNAAILTRQVKADMTDDIVEVMTAIWEAIKSGEKVNNQLYEPEWMQKNLNDIIAEVQASTTLIPADADAGLANLFKTCIKSGINWIKDEDIAEYKWQTISDEKYYGNADRLLKNQYYYVDKKFAWFDSTGIYCPEKDLPSMDWLNHIGQQEIGTPTLGYGNNTTSSAKDEWVFTMDGDDQTGSNFNQYFFGDDGYWDGVSEASDWDWQQTDGKWWFGKSGATSNKDYAHDEWVYIYKSSGTAPYNTPKKYYFGSDGYLLYTKNCSWNWVAQKKKWIFGEAITESNIIFLKNQWMKIDGDWYYFNNNELIAKDKTIRLGLVNYIVSQLSNTGDFTEYTTRLYNRLYQSMMEHCERLYDEEGYDKPSITVTANVVDLSKTTEYEDFPDLMTIHLGDKVKVIDYVHYPDFEYNMRVVGLQYDCIRGYNTQVTIGDLSKKISQMISSNLGGKEGQKLVAGDNVTIDGNTINAITNVGDFYAGSQVDVEQVVTSGTEIAKIYVDGYPTSIYATQVSITPTQLTGNKIADFNINGQSGSLYSPPASGLAYWTETEKEIYKLVVASLPDNKKWECDEDWKTTGFQQYYHNDNPSSWINPFTEKGTSQLACGFWTLAQHDTQYGGRIQWMFVLISDKKTATGAYTGRLDGYAPYYSEGSAWENNLYLMEAWSPAYIDVPTAQGNLWLETVTGKYKYLPYYEEFGRYPTAAQALAYFLDVSNFRVSDTYYSGIGNNDGYVIWGGHTIKENPEITDMPFYVTDDGVVRGAEFEDSEGNPISGGGLSKTQLYNASSYSATVTLSDDMARYQFLLIETYNNDDKQNLSTMLNVADITTGTRVGVHDYLIYTVTNGTTLTFYSSYDDTNHTRYIKAVYGLKTFNGSDVPTIITDVTVNGSTVVSGGVAQIDLTGYAELTDLASKQDTLIAGQNITIAPDGKTISATGGASSVDTLTDVNLTSLANGQILKYNSTSEKWENADETDTTYTEGANIQISANNEISATDTTYDEFDGTNSGLVPKPQSGESGYLKANGTWDEPEGTTVVANPSGTATADLEKLQVGNDIYSIPSGGSGGFVEVTTDILTGQYMNWDIETTGGMAGSIYTTNVTHLQFGITSNYTDSDRIMAVRTVAIPSSAKKIKYRFTQQRNEAQNPSQDMYKVCVGVKATLDTQNYTTPTDNDFIAKKLHKFNAYGTVIEGELEFDYASDVYLYITANGFACDFDLIEVVEYKADLGDLDDVDISSPSNGQVLTYNSSSQKWENSNASGGDTVVVTPIVTTGIKIATITVNGTDIDLYAPSGGGGSGMSNEVFVYDTNSFNNSIGLEGEIQND